MKYYNFVWSSSSYNLPIWYISIFRIFKLLILNVNDYCKNLAVIWKKVSLAKNILTKNFGSYEGNEVIP